MADFETLLGASSVYLFGRPLADIILKGDVYRPDAQGNYKDNSGGGNNFLKTQLGFTEAGFARIYAFSFEGGFFPLERPVVFVVHGPGLDPDYPPPLNAEGQAEYKRLARSPGSSAYTGLGMQDVAFANGTKVWIYDKNDTSMRLDVETGTFEQILLAAEAGFDLAPSGGIFGRSSGGKSSGAMGKSSGSMGKSSNWAARRRDSE